MATTYKFPPQGSQEALLLTELLGGAVIRNHRSMNTIGSPSPATVMSHLRLKRNWDDVIKRQSCSSTSSTGQPTRIKEYFIEAKTIMELKANDPRIEKFLKSNRKS
ncbi:hypothetical protein ACNPMZ_15385 [Acinetobacter pittii]|uniref:hypothetical protein n=1 Tax=Acinetobacter calcoaceticus/baumannii complex TaxID=909768 RepID=UPI000992A020|nr:MULTISPECIES: hypothetical protein [Acinetobacter calcoaceticus/baumannii complex]AQV14231.1 hypothetical protein BMU11_01085 [Acinetobacter pittii]EHU3265762.1 hypothetical protein [Acinetobacter baumannii]MDH2534829.1 hypothetical protein [Acinetobacter baumannii]NDW25949.1 hypothetical protein [Acinetobacter baumannii]OON24583.1 hypothetical protein BI372_14525 [Acinetobacter pittii]